jgi:hypothetical protein
MGKIDGTDVPNGKPAVGLKKFGNLATESVVLGE